MKILITAPSLNPHINVSGISTVVKTIIEHNSTHNYYHYLLGRPDSLKNKFVWYFKLIFQLIYFPLVLLTRKIDLVHQNFPFNVKGIFRELVISFWCFLLRTPVVLHVHGGEFLTKPHSNKFICFLISRIFKWSKVIIVLSELEKEYLVCNYNIYNVEVLSNCVDTNYYQFKARASFHSLPTLLFFGRIHESKGIDDIYTALEKLNQTVSFQFILCGDGPLRESVIERFSLLLHNNFQYRGVLSGPAKLSVFEESDVFLLPSRYGEGLPMALLETMSVGLVPIVTDDASMKMVVVNDFNGCVVAKNNPEDIYNKLSNLLAKEENFLKLSQNAHNTVEANYDIKAYIKILNTLYSRAISILD